MINRNWVFFCLILSLFACNASKETSNDYLSGKEVWDKMMQHYDPEGKLLQSTFLIKFEEGLKKGEVSTHSQILVSHPHNYCAYTQQSAVDSTKAPRAMIWKNGKHLLIANHDTLRTDEEIKAAGMSAGLVDYYGTYYLYIFGLPSNMQSGGVAFPDTVKQGVFMDQKCLVFPIQYPPNNERERWTYYLHPTTFQIIGGSYDYADPKMKGNEAFAELSGSAVAEGFKLIQKHGWYKADSSEWGFSEVTSITLLNPDSVDWLID